MSRRLVTLLDLVDDADLIAAYEAHHAAGQVPRDVVLDIRARGYIDMEIWRVADRLVMIAEVADDFPRRADPALQPAVSDWECEMDRFQKPFAPGPKWAAAKRIFSLSGQ